MANREADLTDGCHEGVGIIGAEAPARLEVVGPEQGQPGSTDVEAPVDQRRVFGEHRHQHRDGRQQEVENPGDPAPVVIGEDVRTHEAMGVEVLGKGVAHVGIGHHRIRLPIREAGLLDDGHLNGLVNGFVHGATLAVGPSPAIRSPAGRRGGCDHHRTNRSGPGSKQSIGGCSEAGSGRDHVIDEQDPGSNGDPTCPKNRARAPFLTR